MPPQQSYKSRKEEFVANLSGGSISEIIIVTLVAPTAALLWSALQSKRSFFIPYGPAAVLTDFLLNVGAILFATTAYSSAPALLNLLLISPAILFSLLPEHSSKSKSALKAPSTTLNGEAIPPSQPGSAILPIRPFLTTYRGAMLIITCIAILAVDFRVFPRRFAKVENWGSSLMDLGVGSFVFSAGIVSARVLLKAGAAKSKTPAAPFATRILSATWHSVPLLVLGFIRLYTVKGLDYAEHVTEYGVHWNFFFTLALLPPFVELSDVLTAYVVPSYEVLALLLASVYEIVLDNTSLKGYILISPRGPDLLSKNREGVFSFIGYLAIFLAGRGTGIMVMQGPGTPARNLKPAARNESAWKGRKSLLRKMALRSALWALIFTISTAYMGVGLRVSRRLANLPYVLWVIAFNNAQLVLFCLIETAFFPEVYRMQDTEAISRSTSTVMQAFNKNGLAIFLVANLLTGAVNLNLNTLDMSSITAMVVLIGYAGVVTGVALALDKAGIKIKL